LINENNSVRQCDRQGRAFRRDHPARIVRGHGRRCEGFRTRETGNREGLPRGHGGLLAGFGALA
jgi:hypothetical protein